jgi:hypothetical protein
MAFDTCQVDSLVNGADSLGLLPQEAPPMQRGGDLSALSAQLLADHAVWRRAELGTAEEALADPQLEAALEAWEERAEGAGAAERRADTCADAFHTSMRVLRRIFVPQVCSVVRADPT